MAQKRMFSLKIIDTDLFLDMPMSTRLLYYDLSMRADDDGFVSSPKKIQKIVGASDDDFKLLIAKQFIIPFESGICVIKHWRIHNYIQKDRYTETIYKTEKKQLGETNGSYEITSLEVVDTKCIQDVSKPDTQIRLDKDSIGKDSLEGEEKPPSKPQKHKYGEYGHVLLTDAEYQSLVTDFNDSLIKDYIKKVDEYIEQYGKKGYKNYNLTIRNWIRKDNKVVEVKPTSGAYHEFNFD